MSESKYYVDPNLTFSEPTTPSGRVGGGILGSLLSPILKTPSDNRRSVVDNTGQIWREADAGSGIYYLGGTRGFASVNLGASSPSSPSTGSGTGGGSVGYSGGTGGMLGGGNFDQNNNPIGPYPFENVFFPQLTQAYERPEAVKRPAGVLDPRNPLSYIPGAYQPGTEQGADLVPGGILEYQPPRLNTGLPTFVGNPYGSLQLPENWEELLTLSEEEGGEKKNRGQSGQMKDSMGNPVGDDYVHPGEAYGGPTLKFT